MRERRIGQTREFMSHLLTRDTFDAWFLAEGALSCAVSWSVDGHIHRDFYPEGAKDDPGEPLVRWSEIRPTVYGLIRGKRTPLSFRFMLQPPPEWAGAADPSEAGGLDRVCRVRFTEGRVYVASAVALQSFSLDREPERDWDEALSRFLTEAGIEYEEL